ncbi:MAG: COG2426 family protein [Lachnospirales bacterium]
METLVEFFVNLFSGINHDVALFIISMIPVIELRGGIIAAALMGVPITKAILICIVGNIIPIPFILLFIDKIFDLLKKHSKSLGKIVVKLENRAMGKSETIQKYEFLGLVLFVGIPLPGTGAWTGALIASLLRIKLKKSVPAIFCGILLACTIMSIVSYLIPYMITNMF